MKSIFLANLDLKENEGIYKKICSEANGLKSALGECVLITKKNNGSKVNYLNNNIEEENANIFNVANKFIQNGDIQYLYVRHMIPNISLIKLLKVANKKGIKIFYEIPTYPYFGEQLKTSRKKYRALIKILLDIIFLPIIYNLAYKMVVIKSNSKVKMYKKMFEINNGANIDVIQSKEYDNCNEKDIFSIVTVGTLYPYHGYDRILKGLKECNELVDNKIVEFSVIGYSQTIDELKLMSNKYNLKHVKFLGIKSNEEMNQLFDNYDVGLGCLALHRRNADIDTTIKIIEYYCRGIPVVTSGISPMDKYNKKITIHIEDSEKPINIHEIYSKYKEISTKDKKMISLNAKSIFSWDSIMKKLFREEI